MTFLGFEQNSTIQNLLKAVKGLREVKMYFCDAVRLIVFLDEGGGISGVK